MPTKYGKEFPAGYSDFEMELWAIEKDPRPEVGGLGRLQHFKNACLICWPKEKWNEWSDKQVSSFLDYETISWTGAASAGKTFKIVQICMIWWVMSPKTTSIVMTSTTATRMKQRFWSALQLLWNSCAKVPNSPLLKNGFPGVLLEADMALRSERPKKNESRASGAPNKSGIFGIAIKEGEIRKAVGDIQGVHNQRMVVCIDEAAETSPAIMEAIPNLRTACSDFKLVMISNPVSRLDMHGMISEPHVGWGNVDVNTDSWRTKAVSKWQASEGICIRFDALKSPNLIRARARFPELSGIEHLDELARRSGKSEFPWLISVKDVARACRSEDSMNSIGFWKFYRGFWRPDGLTTALMNFTMIEKYDGRGKLIFMKGKRGIGSCDPGFGGDNCILQFADLGDLDNGSLGIQLTDTVVVELSATAKDEMEYQIVKRIMQECERRNIKPEDFGVDSTGVGRGVAAVLHKEFGDVVSVGFAEAPSDLPASSEDPKPSYEAYDRKVTELHYQCREFLCNEQLKGLTPDQITEFCYRKYSMWGSKIKLDTKAEAKKEIGHSPDHSDAVAIIIEVARKHGAVAGGKTVRKSRLNNIKAIAAKYNRIYAKTYSKEDDYAVAA